jgi:hypothetical protein
MTPHCPYAKECIQAVWEKRLNRALDRQKAPAAKRRSPSRASTAAP